jgi:hypothetical protein
MESYPKYNSPYLIATILAWMAELNNEFLQHSLPKVQDAVQSLPNKIFLRGTEKGRCHLPNLVDAFSSHFVALILGME